MGGTSGEFLVSGQARAPGYQKSERRSARNFLWRALDYLAVCRSANFRNKKGAAADLAYKWGPLPGRPGRRSVRLRGGARQVAQLTARRQGRPVDTGGATNPWPPFER